MGNFLHDQLNKQYRKDDRHSDAAGGSPENSLPWNVILHSTHRRLTTAFTCRGRLTDSQARDDCRRKGTSERKTSHDLRQAWRSRLKVGLDRARRGGFSLQSGSLTGGAARRVAELSGNLHRTAGEAGSEVILTCQKTDGAKLGWLRCENPRAISY